MSKDVQVGLILNEQSNVFKKKNYIFFGNSTGEMSPYWEFIIRCYHLLIKKQASKSSRTVSYICLAISHLEKTNINIHI